MNHAVRSWKDVQVVYYIHALVNPHALTIFSTLGHTLLSWYVRNTCLARTRTDYTGRRKIILMFLVFIK